MARLPATNVAEVTMTFFGAGQYMMNKHHFINSAGWDEGSLNNLGTAIREWWDDNIRPRAPTTLQLTEIEVVDLSPGSGLGITVQTGLPLSGANTSNALPNNVTVSIKKGTGLVGRSYRGRTYHVGLATGQTVESQLTAAERAILQAAYDLLKEPLGVAIPVDLCVLSEVEDGVLRPEGICTVVTGINIDPVTDSQRRRLPGRGR